MSEVTSIERAAATPLRLVIDCDPGVDDAIAIALACSSPLIKLEAITTVDGNVDIVDVTRNAVATLEICGRADIPVHRGSRKPLEREKSPTAGSHGKDGLGNVGITPAGAPPNAEDAVQYLIDLVSRNPGEITIAAIGPLTNIAHAVRKDPTFALNVKELVVMGGAEGAGNVTPASEFNFWHDPEAADVVFSAGFAQLVMVGLDVTGQAMMGPNVRELLRQVGTPVSRFVHRITRAYMNSYWQRYRLIGAELCDPLVIAYLLDRTILELASSHVEIVTEGLSDGRSNVWRVCRHPKRKANALVAASVHPKRFFEILLNGLIPDASKEIARVLDIEFASGENRARPL
jgi:purine nucleosidase